MANDTYNFYGPTQVLPEATKAEQNFYGDQFAEAALRKGESECIDDLNDAELKLYAYVQNANRTKRYSKMLADCKSPKDVADVVRLLLNEKGITEELVKTKPFRDCIISLVAADLGKSANNTVWRQINSMLNDRNHTTA